MTTNPNDCRGSDSERIQAVVNAAAATGGKVVIPARIPDVTAARDHWLLDRAILLPANTTLVLDNCRLKLSDNSRDNLIRSANCGIGISEIQTLHNIQIIGVGTAVLEGADNPRATGDAEKTLSTDIIKIPGSPYTPVSYGTDAGKAGEKQTSDWRSISVLLAHVENFTLQNLTLKDAHSWAVSLEHCAFGKICDLDFSADGARLISGRFQTFLNQDGLDLRQGCHDITIDGITGHSGDDLVALTAIACPRMCAGELHSHMVSGLEPQGARDDIHDIVIRNVRGSAGGHHLVRFLNASGIKLYRITLDGVIDTALSEFLDNALVRIGDNNPAWGGVTPLGDTAGLIINNVQGRTRTSIAIHGSLCDSVISNVINYNPQTEPVVFASGPQHVRNVTVANAVTVRSCGSASA